MVQVFLLGVIETAKNSIETFDGILQLQKNVEEKIQSLGSRAANAQKILNYLYQRPMIDAARASKVAEVTAPSAYRLISDLERLEILKEFTGGKRGKRYLFSSYLRLFTK